MPKAKQKAHPARWVQMNENIRARVHNGALEISWRRNDGWDGWSAGRPGPELAHVLRVEKMLRMVHRMRLDGHMLTFCGEYNSVNIGCQRIGVKELSAVCDQIRAAQAGQRKRK